MWGRSRPPARFRYSISCLFDVKMRLLQQSRLLHLVSSLRTTGFPTIASTCI